MGQGESYLESDFRARAKDKVTMKQYQECYHLKGQTTSTGCWLLSPVLVLIWVVLNISWQQVSE